MPQPVRELLREIAEVLRKGPARLTLRGAVAPARPFLAAALHRALQVPVLVITAGNREAERFRDEAGFWLPRSERALLFPAREVLPFEPLSPEPGIASARMAALADLAGGGRPLVVSPLEAVLQYLIPRGKLLLARLDVQRGGTIEWDRFRRHLVQWGYRPAARVGEPGEFSQRGGIVDLYPPAQPAPVRIELFGDEVDSIHAFDVETQRNTMALQQVVVLPAREVFLDGGVLGALKKHLVAPEGGPAGGESWLAQHAAALPGLEHYGAALLHSRQTLLDYFAAPPVLLLDEWPDLESRAGKLDQEIAQGLGRAALPGLADPQRVFVGFDRWRSGLAELGVVQFDLFGLAPDADREFSVETATGRAFLAAGGGSGTREGHLPAAVKTIAASQARATVLVVARTPEDAARIGELCREQGLGTAPLDPAAVPGVAADPRPGAPLLTWGPPEEGFSWPAAGIAVLTEDDLFGTRVRAHAAAGPPRGTLVPDFALLRPGDLLVHADYGIGRFGGLVRLPAGDGEEEFLLLLYQDEAKLYVPVGAIDRVQRYIAAEGVRPLLDRLGGRGWVTTKKRAKKAMLGMARELLELAALRQHAPGHAFSADSPWQAEFEMAFDYEPTKDQLRAAEETKADMERPHPMDRLVCGDVGYGKTEVAMRAAFKAVMDGKQVALLAPTTVLAQQHFVTFRERFAPWPTRIEVLSRFVTPKEQRRVVEALARGEVDILIGTHRIVGKDIVFPDLGLLIIDEEQRFGVRHKEALKRMRAHVDVLTLTATPIPRTLHLALSGLRELSLVATPPENRLAIQTTIARFEPALVAEAVRRELARGGQVFFVHNRVKSIFRIAAWLSRLVPEARVGVGHGQMAERELSRVMAAFRGGTLDVLVSTSIVESGLDIPNANTMIVNRADAFGLAELYQLRGRIGRSRHRAFAYLLIPGEDALTDTARRRIEVLREYSHLGAGFQVALFDLEIRGAGNIVGYEQSGQIAALGFEMYAQLLRDTIRELQGEPVPDERPTQVTICLPTVLPEAYVAEMPQRLGFYKRIAAARDPEALEEAATELRERFGPLPEPARNLLRVARLRLAGEALGLERIDWNADTLEFTARRGASVAPERVVALVARSGGRARLAGENRLSWRWRSRDADGRVAEALELLSGLGTSC